MSAAASHPEAIATITNSAPLVLAAGAVGAVSIAGIASIQSDAHEAGTLGAFLQENQAVVRSIVQDAMQNQRDVVVVAGLQVQRAIARAQVAYKDNLDVKADTLGESEGNFKAEIESAITSLRGGANQEIKNAGDRAQVIADKLRLPGDAPQVRSFGPIFLFPFLPFQSINVGGSFPTEYPNGATPKLTVNGKSYKAFTYDAQRLTFSLSIADLDAVEPETIVWRKAELTIPWDKPIFGSLSRVGYENFLVIGVLPHSFGRVTIEHRTNTVRREEKTRLSDDFLLDSNPSGMEESRCLTLSSQEVSDGWKIKVRSGTFIPKARIEGESDIDLKDLGLQSENDRSICWWIRATYGADGYTAAHTANSSREMSWKISAVIWRDVNESRVAGEEVDLAWGSRHFFAYAAGTWKLHYAKFGGSPTEVETADLSNPLLRVSSDGRSVTISTYPF